MLVWTKAKQASALRICKKVAGLTARRAGGKNMEYKLVIKWRNGRKEIRKYDTLAEANEQGKEIARSHSEYICYIGVEF